MTSLRRAIFAFGVLAWGVVLVPAGCSNDNPHPPPTGDIEGGGRDAIMLYDQGLRPDTMTTDVGAPDGADAPSDGRAADGAEVGPIEECGTSCCNGIQDGQETDVDCGGLLCPACGDNKHCAANSDCTSLDCTGSDPGTCQPATCSDNIKNQGESDIDCGGPNCAKCIVGKTCQMPGDCISALCTMNTCSCPPGMIIFPTALPSGGDYCIDSTEVLQKDYETFWTANPTPMNQPAFCSWNMTYTPAGEWPPHLNSMDPLCDATSPVRFVDWCDAYAYCAWAGKRLCGNIAGGANGGANALANQNDHLQSQWYNACSAAGAGQAYPYSGPYQACQCNGADYKTLACGFLNPNGVTYPDEVTCNSQMVDTACQGGASNLYQMSGNVAEWENSCDSYTGGTDHCLVRGGSYASGATDSDAGGPAGTGLTCASSAVDLTLRSTTDGTIGFRCCL